ncbi:response regulator transcription factor [Pseudomonas fluorescens]|jgi:FixJ family two-component response regulator|uniref:response regulator transcription factor n=1 Tax=Pseudomonas fluorescens TaxID=294 RepID=UPI000FAEB398|nr:response regulator [Pseudomonas fluorescens]
MIAVVDDDHAVRASIDSLIRSMGFDAVLFCSAQEFLESPERDAIVCLITDVQMPSMSGIELHEWLMGLGIRIPTIFITAFPEEIVRKRAMTGSAVGFLAKPFQGKMLIDCLETALARPAMQITSWINDSGN